MSYDSEPKHAKGQDNQDAGEILRETGAQEGNVEDQEPMTLEDALDLHKRWVMDALSPQRSRPKETMTLEKALEARRQGVVDSLGQKADVPQAPEEVNVGDQKVRLANRGEVTLQEALDFLCHKLDAIITRENRLEVELSKLGRWIP